MAAEPQKPNLSLGKKFLFAGIILVVVFGGLELLLAALGVEPRSRTTDPFVGFAASNPLFAKATGPGGQPIFVTATNKREYFNTQSFPAAKAPGTVRIFCFGGSTTYGRPYADPTSFPGWLRVLLPVADPGTQYEVINVGGISYASYRVARLVEEMTIYEPDVFIIYSGHNEFLEERTYGDVRDRSKLFSSAIDLVSHSRLGAAVARVVAPENDDGETDARSILPNEVQARLDHSAGLDLYERDDELTAGVLSHYRFSLERMLDTAESAGVPVILVSPASNLASFSPFKSSPDDEARDADRLYVEGRTLAEAGRYDEARDAFIRARDEDVCTLRATTPMQEIVLQVAKERSVPLVDYPALLEAEAEHRMVGENFFLDHVHPTIEGHRMLALALVDAMTEQGLVQPGPGWTDPAVADIARKVEASVTTEEHARALANLALTLSWAGKAEDSYRLTVRALESGVEDPTILMMAARHAALTGAAKEARGYFRRAVAMEPGSPVLHSQFGFFLAGQGQLEAALCHFLVASLLWDDNEIYHQQLGFTLQQLGRPSFALRSLTRAAQLAPQNDRIRSALAVAEALVLPEARRTPAVEPVVTRYPSGYPRTISQAVVGGDGRPVIHGIVTEWYDGGALKKYVEFENGAPRGTSVSWDETGVEIDRFPARP